MYIKAIKRAIPASIKKLLRRLLNMLNLGIDRLDEYTQVEAENTIVSLDPYFRSALASMYRGEPQFGSDGQFHSIDKKTRTHPENGMWIYDFYRSTKPKSSLEIGLAYGYSTLFIMAAMYETKIGHHTMIDPNQNSHWKGIGLTHAQKASELGLHFSFIEDRSDYAFVDLARANRKFDFIFIDGNHKFDDVLVDFYLYASLCSVGGHVIFDDYTYNSIQSVIAFIRANRSDFKEIHNTPDSWCVFERIGHDQRHWKHFKKFKVANDSHHSFL